MYLLGAAGHPVISKNLISLKEWTLAGIVEARKMGIAHKDQSLLHADGSGSGPVGVADSREHHVEDSHRVFAFDDAVAHFVQRSVLDRSGVPDDGVGSA